MLTVVAMLSIVVIALASARAEELTSNLTNVTSGTESATIDRWLAASFSTDASTTYHLSSVTLLLANTSPGTAALELYSDGDLEPGNLVATLTSPASYSNTMAATTFSANDLSLDATATYWVVLRALDGTFDWAWTAENAGNGSGFHPTWDSSEDAGAAWHTQDIYPMQFRVTVALNGEAAPFLRGDTNQDGSVDISDAIATLVYLFGGATVNLGCRDAADSNDDGQLDLSDAVFTLNFKFLGGLPIPAPGPDVCGSDPTTDNLPQCTYNAAVCKG